MASAVNKENNSSASCAAIETAAKAYQTGLTFFSNVEDSSAIASAVVTSGAKEGGQIRVQSLTAVTPETNSLSRSASASLPKKLQSFSGTVVGDASASLETAVGDDGSSSQIFSPVPLPASQRAVQNSSVAASVGNAPHVSRYVPPLSPPAPATSVVKCPAFFNETTGPCISSVAASTADPGKAVDIPATSSSAAAVASYSSQLELYAHNEQKVAVEESNALPSFASSSSFFVLTTTTMGENTVPASAATQRTRFKLNRYVLLLLHVLYVFASARVLFGWPNLSNMLFRSEAFAWLCDSSDALPSPLLSLAPGRGGERERPRYLCRAQDNAVQLLFTVGIAVAFCCSLLAGCLMDWRGPRVCAVVGQVLNTTGWVLLGFAEKKCQTYIPAVLCLALGADAGYLPSLTVSNLFPNHEGLVVVVLSAAMSASFSIPTLMDISWKNHPDTLSFKTICFLYAGLGTGLCALTALLFFPSKPYASQEELDHAAVAREGEEELHAKNMMAKKREEARQQLAEGRGAEEEEENAKRGDLIVVVAGETRHTEEEEEDSRRKREGSERVDGWSQNNLYSSFGDGNEELDTAVATPPATDPMGGAKHVIPAAAVRGRREAAKEEREGDEEKCQLSIRLKEEDGDVFEREGEKEKSWLLLLRQQRSSSSSAVKRGKMPASLATSREAAAASTAAAAASTAAAAARSRSKDEKLEVYEEEERGREKNIMRAIQRADKVEFSFASEEKVDEEEEAGKRRRRDSRGGGERAVSAGSCRLVPSMQEDGKEENEKRSRSLEATKGEEWEGQGKEGADVAGDHAQAGVLSFREQLRSPYFVCFFIYWPLNALFYNFYMTSAENLFNREVNDLLGILGPLSMIPSVLLGKLADVYGVMSLVLFIASSAVCMYAFALVPAEWCYYASAVFSCLYVSNFSGQMYAYIRDTFLSRDFGKVVGLTSAAGGLLALLRIPLHDELTLNVLHGNYKIVCGIMLAITLCCLGIAVRLFFLKKQKLKAYLRGGKGKKGKKAEVAAAVSFLREEKGKEKKGGR